MRFLRMNKVREGRFLKNYELYYENKAGKEKKYEIVSFNDLESEKDIGKSSQGVSIVAFCEGKILLLKEFRMGVNKAVINLCAGKIDAGESVEDCVKRELYEETGLSVKKIYSILPPAFAALSITDIKNTLVFIEAEGTVNSDNAGENEEISAGLYTKEECLKLLEEYDFSSRCQIITWLYTKNALENLDI